MALIAQLNDADISLELDLTAGVYRVKATRYDGVDQPVVVHDETYGTLGETIKAITIFYVGEWESVFITNRLSEKMVSAIQAQ